jgi:hypothetical protein
MEKGRPFLVAALLETEIIPRELGHPDRAMIFAIDAQPHVIGACRASAKVGFELE